MCFSSPVIIAYFKLFNLLIDNNDKAALGPTPLTVRRSLNIASSSFESKPYRPIKSSLTIWSTYNITSSPHSGTEDIVAPDVKILYPIPLFSTTI